MCNNKHIFWVLLGASLAIGSLEGKKIFLLAGKNQISVIDTEDEHIHCVYGMSFNDQDDTLLAFTFDTQPTTTCYIGQQDWQHIYTSPSNMRDQWLKQSLDPAKRKVKAVRIFKRNQHFASFYRLEQVIVFAKETAQDYEERAKQDYEERAKLIATQTQLLEPLQLPAFQSPAWQPLLGGHEDLYTDGTTAQLPIAPSQQILAAATPADDDIANYGAIALPQRSQEPSPVQSGTLRQLAAAWRTSNHHRVNLTDRVSDGQSGTKRRRKSVPDLVATEVWNYVIGCLAKTDGKILHLSELGLSTAQLQSIIIYLPKEIKNNITVLQITGNCLDTLPTEIAQLKNVAAIEAGGNQFTSLPSAIFKLDHLQDLSLDRTVTVPASLETRVRIYRF